MNIQPVTLEGRHIRLEPLTLSHHAGLCDVGLVPELWRWIPVQVHNADDMRAYIEEAMAWQHALRQHRTAARPAGNWLDMGGRALAALAGQHGSEVSDDAARLRATRLH